MKLILCFLSMALLVLPACRDKKQPELRYDAKNSRLRILFGAERLIDSVNSKPRMQRVEHASMGSVWLVQFSRSDSCPSEYVALLPGDRTSEVFGNCNEISEIQHKEDHLELLFADDEVTGRAAEKVDLR